MTVIFIAGNLSAADWYAARDAARKTNDPAQWKKAFDDFFQQRLDLRYLAPIKTLQTNGTKLGEGFTIAAIQCTLIEFLAASRIGKTYRYGQKEDDLYYSKSSKLFTDFLLAEPPFSALFDANSASAFYENVRCGLLHEARTKGGWTIWADSGSKTATAIDATEKVVYRDDLQKIILEYIARYRDEIATDSTLREAFIRKIDDLCQS